MHMADALLSPSIGIGGWMVAGIVAAFSARQLKKKAHSQLLPRMAILGAFVFAAQMLNFSIPGTGSSGHIGGGILLAIMLGAPASFLVICTVITMQALFFADGGLLAMGANIINLGFFSSFIAYPLVFRLIASKNSSKRREMVACVLASVASLQMAAFAVVLETTASGISALPFHKFVLLMLPVHLVIGVVEGFLTAWVIAVLRERSVAPRFNSGAAVSNVECAAVAGVVSASGRAVIPVKVRWIGFAVLALFLSGIGSWFASRSPDGLEWTVSKVSGSSELSVGPGQKIHKFFESVQKKTSILADYSFAFPEEAVASAVSKAEGWPAIDVRTSVSGMLGSVLTFGSIFSIGLLFSYMKRKAA